MGALERLTIVAGAVIIGYWGYRLYTAEKNAGLIFMGLAVLVLVGALVTGGSHLRSVGEGYQLASLPADAAGQNPPYADADSVSESDLRENAQNNSQADARHSDPAIAADPVAATDELTPVADEASVADESSVADEAPAADITPAADKRPVAVESAMEAIQPVNEAATDAVVPEPEESPVRLATGAELGGRIVSVKSENVSLEWSSNPDPSGDAGSE